VNHANSSLAPGGSTPPHPPSPLRLFLNEHRRALWLIILCTAWMLPGLVGHDPWKPDEAYTFGLIYHIVRSGHWVVPMLAGEPFMEKPPLYYVTAALFARWWSPWLPLQDAARLASGFYMGIVFVFTGLGARELLGRGKGSLAVLVLLGCLGLLVRAHEMITDVALLAGFAVALYGLALAQRRGVLGGVMLGTGVGIGFLSKGLLAPGIIGLIALLLLWFRPWRTRRYGLALGVACVAALPWLTVWPFLLYRQSPHLFHEWFWINNLGRFLGFADLGTTAEPAYYLKTLPWYAWPALPLALWTLWHRGRRGGFRQPAVHLPLLAFLVMLAVLGVASDARDVYAMPMLLPLSLLAADAVDTLKRGAASALDWFGFMTFGLFSGVIWLYWIATLTGWPARMAGRAQALQPAYHPVFDPLSFGIALLYTVAWLLLVSRMGRSNRRSVINWAAGLTLMWGLLMTLWLPWINTGMSYRSMIGDLQRALPAHHGCIASRSLGEPQRALLQYYAGIVTRRLEVHPHASCRFLLQQGFVGEAHLPGRGWREIWEGARPGDRRERYWLYRRDARRAR